MEAPVLPACREVTQLLTIARKAGTVLTRVVPATIGVEDAVLDHLEASVPEAKA